MRVIQYLPFILLSGCVFLPSDGGFSVSGEIISENGEAIEPCSLSLFTSDDGKLRRRTEVSSKFSASFVVAPSDSIYKLQLECKGYSVREFTVNYGKDVLPSKPLLLDKVVMDQHVKI